MIMSERTTEAPTETYTKVDHDQPPNGEHDNLDQADGETSPGFERTGNQLSVSRSGRHKQRLRRRSTIFENPTLGRSAANKSPRQSSGDGQDQENKEPGEPEEEENNDGVCWILYQKHEQDTEENFHGDTLWITQV
ncbi:uncharacterized protein LOC125946267 [Dermacentor silvarum]|uniref:uncharacterized protein LOC125946267 n=1 Tax=Dermacentor silvarum TaxID=543639 RepID=UPI0021016AFA|nr:uncharacterized protein LOC125946267 [Dermacentor silvarum]